MKPSRFTLIFNLIFLLNFIIYIQGKPLRKLEESNIWKKFENYEIGDEWPEGLPYENYIIVFYEQEALYKYGFVNEYRKNISYILYGDMNISGTDQLTVAAGSKIEIYFSSPLTSLESFFDRLYDDKVEYIKTVDLSHLDVTQITSFAFTFCECFLLYSVTPPKIPTLSLTTMESMLESCQSLFSFDLTKYYAKNLVNVKRLFSECKSLKLIDISWPEFPSLESTSNIFENIYSLTYINVGIDNYYNEILEKLPETLTSKSDFNLCPYEGICCDMDFETGKCINSTNYITVYYGRDAEYREFYSVCGEECLDHIQYIKIGETPQGLFKKFKVKNGTKLDIFFSSSITSLKKFFYNYKDIISVDFSHFDSSKITNINSMFYGCESLKSVDLTSFKSLPINNLTNLFFGCKELTSINISYISNVIINNYRSCFESCISLKILDLSGLSFSKAEEDQNNPIDYSVIFKKVNHLKYLNLIGTSIPDELKEHIPKNNLIVCQDENNKIFQDDDNVINKCCDLNEDLEICHASNYIVVYYDNDENNKFNISLNNGFAYENVDYLDKISYMYLNDEKIDKKGTIHITTGSKLEIFFSSSLTSLDSFFNSENVNYANNIISVDFSHLDVSNLNSINNLFYKCSTLKSVNLSNFNKASIKEMEGAFSRCKNLKSFDLSSLNTASITNINNAFSWCTSLQAFYMVGLDLSKAENADNAISAFDDDSGEIIMKLKYLDITNSTLSESLKEVILKSFNKLIICEKDGYFAKQNEQYKDFCCDFNIETEKCQSSNYIIVYYPNDKSDAEYQFSLTENYKDQINFIINDDMLATKNDLPININQNNFQIEIHLKSSLTSLESFFEGMENIISVDLSHLDSSSLTSVKKMFYKCTSVKSIEIQDINTENLIDMSSMFEGCSGLTLVNFRNFNTDNVIDMNSIFSGCSSLKFLDISFFNLKNVSNNENMFKGIEKLAYLNLYGIRNFDKMIVEDNLNKIDNLVVCQKENFITNEKASKECCLFDTSIMECESNTANFITLYYGNRVEYNYGFSRICNSIDCSEPTTFRENINFILYKDKKINPEEKFIIEAGSKITVYFLNFEIDLKTFFDQYQDYLLSYVISIDLSHFFSSKLIKMDSMFEGLNLLISINLANLNASQVTDMNSMFLGCERLKSINLQGFITSSVTDMRKLFFGCSSLKSIDLHGLMASSLTDMYQMFFGCSSLEFVNLSNLNASQVTDMSFMFEGCTSLKSVDFHGFITSSVTDMCNMFEGCTSLKSVDFHGFVTSSVTDMSGIFYECTSLESINFSNFDTSNVVEMYEMFKRCYSLKYIDLSHFDTSHVTDMNSMFEDCFSLELVNLSNWNTSQVGDMNSMFKQCSSLKYLNLSNFITSSLNDMSEMFYGCSSLKYIDLSQCDTSYVTDMWKAFYKCSSLESLDLSSFNTSSVEDMGSLFCGCNKLKYLTLSNFNTSSIEYIDSMFLNVLH